MCFGQERRYQSGQRQGWPDHEREQPGCRRPVPTPSTWLDIEAPAGLAVRTGLTQADYLARWARRRARAPTHLVIYQAMPGLGGEDVLRELARRQRHARVVITIGRELQRLQAAAALALALGRHGAGAQPKPFKPRRLRQLLQAA